MAKINLKKLAQKENKSLEDYKILFGLEKRDHKYWVGTRVFSWKGEEPHRFIIKGDPEGFPKGTFTVGTLRDDLDKSENTYTGFASYIDTLKEACEILFQEVGSAFLKEPHKTK